MTTYRLYTIDESDEIDEILRATEESAIAAEVRRRWPDAVGCPNPGSSTPQLWIWPSYDDYAEWFHANLGDFAASRPLPETPDDAVASFSPSPKTGPRMCAVVDAECPAGQIDSPFSIATWAPNVAEAAQRRIRELGGDNCN